jgi:hypothetical protein
LKSEISYENGEEKRIKVIDKEIIKENDGKG